MFTRSTIMNIFSMCLLLIASVTALSGSDFDNLEELSFEKVQKLGYDNLPDNVSSMLLESDNGRLKVGKLLEGILKRDTNEGTKVHKKDNGKRLKRDTNSGALWDRST